MFNSDPNVKEDPRRADLFSYCFASGGVARVTQVHRVIAFRHTRVIRRLLLAATCCAVTSTGSWVASGAASATPTQSDVNRTNSSIAAARNQAKQIQAQIAGEQAQLETLSNQYDQATYQLQQVEGALQTTAARLVV